MIRLCHPRAALKGLVPAVLVLFALAAQAQISDYAMVVAVQLVEAMKLDRDTGKAAEGARLTVDVELNEAGRIVASTIVAIEEAPDEATRLAVQDALANALAHHQSIPFDGLRAEDRDAWGRMRVTWVMSLHIGGYQP